MLPCMSASATFVYQQAFYKQVVAERAVKVRLSGGIFKDRRRMGYTEAVVLSVGSGAIFPSHFSLPHTWIIDTVDTVCVCLCRQTI